MHCCLVSWLVLLPNHHRLCHFLAISLYFHVAHHNTQSLTTTLTIIFNFQSQLAPILQLPASAIILIKVEIAGSQCSLHTNIHHHLAVLNCAVRLQANILNTLTHIVQSLGLRLILQTSMCSITTRLLVNQSRNLVVCFIKLILLCVQFLLPQTL